MGGTIPLTARGLLSSNPVTTNQRAPEALGTWPAGLKVHRYTGRSPAAVVRCIKRGIVSS